MCFVNCTFWYHLEAEKQELINEALGTAEAVVAAGKARAQSIELVSKALCGENGQNAAALAVAEKYVGAFGELAKTNNTLILPANTGDVSSMVAQVIFKINICEYINTFYMFQIKNGIQNIIRLNANSFPGDDHIWTTSRKERYVHNPEKSFRASCRRVSY